MVILTRLLPWILFGIGQALIGPSGAASLAAAGALLLIALSLKTGHRLSELILDSAVLMYFLGFAVLSVLAPRSSAVRYVAAGPVVPGGGGPSLPPGRDSPRSPYRTPERTARGE